jgi:4-amino-4-deoxy-L-arabinose transferase-like glycosyltransferase
MPALFNLRIIIFFWFVLCLNALVFLPGFSEYDTQKYLSIAHQMIDHHQYLIAQWENKVYSDKPPLLFWLIILGWHVLGYLNQWPQALVLILGSVSLFISYRLAQQFWPNTQSAKIAALLTVTCFQWFWCVKAIRVDSLLCLAVLLACLSVYHSLFALTRKTKILSWLGYSLAIALGAFAKGPVILIFVLVPACLMPFCFSCPARHNLKNWYGLLAVTTLLGFALILAWAVPAIYLGGEQFAREIAFQQITHRATLHQEAFYYYLARLPLYLLPWSLYPPVYLALYLALYRAVKHLSTNRPLVWCVVFVVSSLSILSVFGQKLPHYIFPSVAIVLLVLANSLNQLGLNSLHSPKNLWLLAFFIFGVSLFCLGFNLIETHLSLENRTRGFFLHELHLSAWGLIFLSLSLVLFVAPVRTLAHQLLLIGLAQLILSLFVFSTVLYRYEQHLSIQPIIMYLTSHTDSPLALSPNSVITQPELTTWLKQSQRKLEKPQNFDRWRLDHPKGIGLSSSLTDLTTHPITFWMFQERYRLLALIPAISVP